MPLITQFRIFRSDLQKNPDVLYIMGDNLLRKGFAGQAQEMRGEPNTVGLPTKRYPGMNETDFFTDADLEEVEIANEDAVARLHEHLSNGGIVVWPEEGIGTGLSQLPQRAPKIMEYYNDLFKLLKRLYPY